jgi:hypothetical protein
MIKASALYIVIIIALVIGLLCSSLIVVAYFYRLQYQQTFRHEHLQDNLNSAINILTNTQSADFETAKTFSLFGRDNDSVSLKSIAWGLYNIGVGKAFIQKDTLQSSFLLGCPVDSSKWAALYIIDEDRPISLSGNTNIIGDAFLPKAGVKEAYVDNKSYRGSKRLIQGQVKYSEKKLPALSDARIGQLSKYFNLLTETNNVLPATDTLRRSFFDETAIFQISKNAAVLQNMALMGNVIITCDTTLVIENSTYLENAIIIAKSLVVKSGFKGTVQLFATDSLSVGNNCTLNYPSVLGICRLQPLSNSTIAKLSIGENTTLTGVVFSYDINNDRNKQPYIGLQKNVNINGQVYAHGILELKSGVVVNGSVFTNRFFYRSGFASYENYIIDATFNASALSKYYLAGDLVPVVLPKKKILQWLEKK